MNVLVLNCFSRNGMAACNALDNSCTVYGGATCSTKAKKSLLEFFKSKRISKVLNITSPKINADGFKQDIIRYIKEFGIDVVIPTGTVETDYLSLYKKEILSACNVYIAAEDIEKHRKVADKWETVCICREVRVPTPKTEYIEKLEDVRATIENGSVSFPMVIKPTRAFASEGVAFFENMDEVDELLNSGGIAAHNAPWIIQEKIAGTLHDVTSCSKDGEPHAILSQQRIMTWFDFGGGGIVNITTDQPEIIDYARRVLASLNWNGILEFDFIKSPSGEYFLLECNPKIWGTTQLSIEAGMNVPQMLIDLFVSKRDVKPIENYEKQLMYKWVFPYCIVSWLNKPFTVDRVLQRIKKTAMKSPNGRTLSNVQVKNIRHLIGCAINRLAL